MAEKNKNNINQILVYLKKLEERIARLESHLGLESTGGKLLSINESPQHTSEASDQWEFQIGHFWFAKVGIVVLAIGIVFLLTFPYQDFPAIFPSFLGYILVAGLILTSHFLKKSFSFLSGYIFGGGLVLLYFATMRLHYFGEQLVISDKTIIIILLIIIVFFNLFLSVRRNSIYLTGINLTLGYVTTILSTQPYLLFSLNLIISLTVIYLYFKQSWHSLMILGIFFTFFTHFIWFINNPFMNTKIQLVSEPAINLFFLLAYVVIFSIGVLFHPKEFKENTLVIGSTLLNCLGGFGLFLLITVTRFPTRMGIFHLSASLIFLLLSIAFWLKEKSKYPTFFYAISGYTALSVAIIAYFENPDFFIWLCWQSLLVIITAIWFRSKIIVLTNFIIFLLIFITFLLLTGTQGNIGLSFGVVALFSARIMNWQKHRLELKTEFMRNAYLITTLIILPYSFYFIFPKTYIILSWIGISILYYIFSITLKNKKYRWMAILTLLFTALYVLVIGIIKLEPKYRIISFLVLGSFLLIVSVIYGKIKVKSGESKQTESKSPDNE